MNHRWRILITALFVGLFPLTLMASEGPVLVDGDNDGLTDEQERTLYHTDPRNGDTDGDGYLDGQEIARGYSPLVAGPDAKLNNSDADHDGLSDALEYKFHTDPTNPDTDGDGYLDGAEIKSGYDPNNVSDRERKLERKIVINLKQQRMQKVLGGVTLTEYPISSGKWSTPTPKGTFAIRNKTPRAWSKQYKLYMPWWMAFTAQGHGIHELPEWRNGTKEGANHLGKPVSHGCIRLGIGPAKEMYDFAPIGTKVVVQ